MKSRPVHQCKCAECQSPEVGTTQMLHHQINVVMSRLDEQQRRWYAAVEANRYGHGGARLVHRITGLDEQTIRRGQRELAEDLVGRPSERVRLPGAGRPSAEKKMPPFQTS